MFLWYSIVSGLKRYYVIHIECHHHIEFYNMVVIVSPHSSSLSNPCPSGTGIGYGEFNGTIFVIYDCWCRQCTGPM